MAAERAVSYDPYYEEPAAQWLRGRLEDSLDIEFNIDDQLETVVAASRGLRAIWIRPGLPFLEFHWLVCRGILYVEWGKDLAPEFVQPDDQINSTVAVATLLPFDRTPDIDIAIATQRLYESGQTPSTPDETPD